MKCNVVECVFRNNCGILEITSKQPKDWRSCSYFTDQKKVEKKNKKQKTFESNPKLKRAIKA
jgi:hypothetical protein